MCEWSSKKEQNHNIFIVDEYDSSVFKENQIKMITRYHKEYSINDDVKMIHRFLFQKMNALIIWNVWLIKSTWNTLHKIHNEKRYRRQWTI